jgi:uncharacterized protein YdeI (YjbR/CyaY-like superfamily)
LQGTYDARPPYQRNDYLIWISQAKTPETRDKRVRQMIDELKRGNVYHENGVERSSGLACLG